jgi:hypothetical protein
MFYLLVWRNIELGYKQMTMNDIEDEGAMQLKSHPVEGRK